MRTLNKTLCLVLCIALCFTLVGSAFANNTGKYTDAAKVGKDYFEAVDVMVGIGIINGTSATTLDPQGTYTREQAAKIITYMRLGEAAANNLKSTSDPFADVKATDWAAPYIQYCVENNIIAGAGDGNFYPKNVVSGYEMGKMVLCALGYGVNDEYEGSAWNINVAKDGIKLGIFGDTNTMQAALATGEKLTREQAIYVAWEGLFEKTVTWSTLLDQYVTGNIFGIGSGDTTVTTTVYGTLAEVVFGVGKTTAILRSTQFSTDGTTAALLGTGDAKYADKTVEDITVADAMDYAGAGYRYNVYFKTDSKYLTATKYTDVVDLAIRKDGLIGYYADAASAGMTALPVVYGVTTAKTFNLYVAAAGLSFPSAIDAHIDYYYNYNYYTPINNDDVVASGTATAEEWANYFLTAFKNGAFNGYTLVDNNKDGIVDAFLATDYTVAEVSSVTSTNYYFEGTQSSIKIANAKGDTLVANDVAMIYKMGATTNYALAKAATASGTIASYDSINGTVNTITVGDKSYSPSNEYFYVAVDTPGAINGNAPIILNEGLAAAPDNVGGEEQTFWFDPYGAVLGFSGSKNASGIYDLAYVAGFRKALAGSYVDDVYNYYAYVIFADGTAGEYKIDSINSKTVVEGVPYTTGTKTLTRGDVVNDNIQLKDYTNNKKYVAFDNGTTTQNFDTGLFNATIKSNGKVALKDAVVYGNKFTAAYKLTDGAAQSVKNGNAFVGKNPYPTGYPTYANDKTVYFFVNGTNPLAANFEYEVFTGYAKAATPTGTYGTDWFSDAAIYGNAAASRNTAAIGILATGGWTSGEGADVYFFDGVSAVYKKTAADKVSITYTLWKDGVSETYTVSTVTSGSSYTNPVVPGYDADLGAPYMAAGFYKKASVSNGDNTGLKLVSKLNISGTLGTYAFTENTDGYSKYYVYGDLTSNVLTGVNAQVAAMKAAGATADEGYRFFTTTNTKVIDTRTQHTDKYTDKDYLGEITSVEGIKQAAKEGYIVVFHVAYATSTTANYKNPTTAPAAKYIYVTLAQKSTSSSDATLTGSTNVDVNGSVVYVKPAQLASAAYVGTLGVPAGATVYFDNAIPAAGAIYTEATAIKVVAADGTTKYYTVDFVDGVLTGDNTSFRVNGTTMTVKTTTTGTTLKANIFAVAANAAIIEAATKITVTDGWGTDVTTAVADGNIVNVTFKNGTTASYTIVLG